MPPTPPSSSLPMASKRGKQYHRLTMEKKAAIINLVECGRSQADVGKEFGISKPAISDFLKNKDKILETAHGRRDQRPPLYWCFGVSIATEVTFEQFVDADNELDFCAELTDDEIVIVGQVMADSDDSNAENEEPAPPTSAELTRALVTLSSVYSGDRTLAQIEANMIACKRNAVQTKISKFFKPLQQ